MLLNVGSQKRQHSGYPTYLLEAWTILLIFWAPAMGLAMSQREDEIYLFKT